MPGSRQKVERLRLGREGMIVFQGVPGIRPPGIYTVGPATTSGQACQKGMFLFKRTSIQGEPVVFLVVWHQPDLGPASLDFQLTERK